MIAMPTFKAAATSTYIISLLPSATTAFSFNRPLLHQIPSKSIAASSAASSPDWFSTSQSPAQLLECIDQISKPQVDHDASRVGPESIFARINEDHDRDIKWAQASSLPFESETSSNGVVSNSIEYESIYSANNLSVLVIRSKLSTPLLSSDEIQLLRGASESYWNRSLDKGNDVIPNDSRFTYQRKGNSEAHLSDVVQHAYHQCNAYNALTSLVRSLLLNRIYPWIRAAYLSQVKNGDELELYVYDSLLIRYNATEANADFDNNNDDQMNLGGVGAGQPLHRDLGYVSVNIMLNSQDEFEGGGTFFEDQLLPLLSSDNQCNEMHTMQPLKPLGPGHALAHYSNSRHAGAATHAGARDILVIFLAAKDKTTYGPDSIKLGKVPCWEYNARIKSNARAYCSECSSTEEQLICRIEHHRLAIDQVIDDGEAWHYLGMAILDYHDHLQQATNEIIQSDVADGKIARAELELAVSCLHEATKYTPCDGRLYNNLGIAFERLLQYETTRSLLDLHERVSSAYETSIMIHSTCDQRCDVGVDYASACLNYGLYLSKRDQFSKAIDVLSKIVPQNDRLHARYGRLITDASNLLSFCIRQLNFT